MIPSNFKIEDAEQFTLFSRLTERLKVPSASDCSIQDMICRVYGSLDAFSWQVPNLGSESFPSECLSEIPEKKLRGLVKVMIEYDQDHLVRYLFANAHRFLVGSSIEKRLKFAQKTLQSRRNWKWNSEKITQFINNFNLEEATALKRLELAKNVLGFHVDKEDILDIFYP